MACYGCNDCNCTHSDTFSKDTHKQLKDKLSIFHDLVCVVSNTSCYDFPKVMAKFIYMLWCFLTDLVNLIMCLWERSRTLKKRDEELCSAMASNFNKLNTYMRANARYQAQLSEAINNVNTEGYATQVISQPFSMLDETGTIISTSKQPITRSAFKAGVKDITNYPNDDLSTAVAGDRKSAMDDARFFSLTKGETLKVVYDMNETRFGNTDIERAEVTYTLVEGGYSNKSYLAVYPTITGSFHFLGNTAVKNLLSVNVKFFDSEGNKVSVKGGYIAFNSLNAVSGSSYEGISSFAGSYVTINGSTISNVGGVAKATSSNADGGWDREGADNFYMGSIIGKINSEDINFNFELGNKQWAWFKLDTNIQSKAVPKEPTIPKLTGCPDLSQMTCGFDKG